MKKVLISIFIVMLLFSSCVTRPITKDDYRNVTGKSLWTVWIPGVTQMINGEYLKGALMLSSFALVSGIANKYRGSDGEAIPGEELEYNLLMGASLAVLAGSVVDGVMTTNILKDQKIEVDIENSLFKLNELEKLIPDLEERVALPATSYEKKKDNLTYLQNEIAIAERYLRQDVKDYEQIRKDFEYELSIYQKNIISIGMSREALFSSMGNPNVINKSVGTWGIDEQFVYRKENGNDIYVYVENGVVTSWQF